MAMVWPRVAGLIALGAVQAAHAAPATPRYFDRPDPSATRRVSIYLAKKDCARAVAALNEDLKSRQRDVLLLAGSMFDTGLCVKPDWERAVHYYQLADAAGNLAAIPRLASGYAVPGRDNAVALWWMAHRPGSMPGQCVPSADPEGDPDGFEKQLAAMPQSLLKACIYMTGVYASLLAETEFPVDAIRDAVYGDIDMEFRPAEGAITWRQGQRERAGAPAYEEQRRQRENALLAYMRAAGERTLARYPKPEGIPPGTVIAQRFSFYFD